jgi:hypothetical protein
MISSVSRYLPFALAGAHHDKKAPVPAVAFRMYFRSATLYDQD